MRLSNIFRKKEKKKVPAEYVLVGTVKSKEFNRVGIASYPVTLFVLKSDDGQEHYVGLPGTQAEPSEGDRIQAWLNPILKIDPCASGDEAVVATDWQIISRNETPEGVVEVTSVRRKYFRVLKYRILGRRELGDP